MNILYCIHKGYLATTPGEYARAVAAALDTMSSSADTAVSSLDMRRAARQAAQRFSDEAFSEDMEEHFKVFLQIEIKGD